MHFSQKTSKCECNIERGQSMSQYGYVGIIGVGMIGYRFTRKFLEAGFSVAVYDIDTAKMEAAREIGATIASSPKGVAERVEAILLCLPGSPAVEAAMNGSDGILAGIKEDQIVIDTGTTRPATDIEYAAKVRERGGRMVDAPITGRRNGFIIMVGGTKEDFRKAEPFLKIVGYKVVHVGALGYGQRLKLVNQFILAGKIAVYAEATSTARNMDLSPDYIVSILEFGEAESLIRRTFSVPGGQLLNLHTKDLEYLSELIEKQEIYAPLTKLVTEIFRETRRRAERDWAQNAILTHWEGR